MFFSKKLLSFDNIKHCFFSRKNGVSQGVYESLNCGLGSSDNEENVLQNLEFVSKKIGCEKNLLITLNQKHSNKVIYFEKKSDIKNKLQGDAIISKVKNVAIGILAADCAPIFFYDPKKKIIACAHSGWKGALRGIIKNTVKKFSELNSASKDLIAVVGPCIEKENYQVKNDFYEKFILQDKKNEYFFRKIDNGKFIFDLREFINKELFSLDIKNVENIKLDTFSKNEFFYSYRRSVINKENDYGRCISVILMT